VSRIAGRSSDQGRITIAHIQVTFPFLHIRKITGFDQLYVKFLRMRRFTPERIPAGKPAEALLVAGVYEYCWLHTMLSLF